MYIAALPTYMSGFPPNGDLTVPERKTRTKIAAMLVHHPNDTWYISDFKALDTSRRQVRRIFEDAVAEGTMMKETNIVTEDGEPVDKDPDDPMAVTAYAVRDEGTLKRFIENQRIEIDELRP